MTQTRAGLEKILIFLARSNRLSYATGMALHNPHDRFFKLSFGDPAVAADFLRHYLPIEIQSRIDLDSLTLVDGSFVDEDLAEQQTDLLYTATLKDGQAVHVYFLFEHKSYLDRWVILQLLKYMTQQWLEQVKDSDALTPILPIVIYHGEEIWPFPLGFHEFFDGLSGFEPFTPSFSIRLHDFSARNDPEIRGELLLRALLTTLMRVKDRRFSAELDHFIELVFELEILGQPYLIWLRSILYYLVDATETITKQDLDTAVKNLGPRGDKLMPTIAMQYRQEGQIEAFRQMVLNTLKIRFGADLDHVHLQLVEIESAELLNEASQEAVRCESVESFIIWLSAQQ